MSEDVEKKVPLLKALLGGVVLSVVMLLLSVLLGIIAINHLGVFDTWLKWREGNYVPLLLWRLTLYGTIVFGWLKLKAHLPGTEAVQASKGTQRIEFLVLLLFVIIEISKAPIAWSEVL
ncbi:hypothetical protein DA83_17780 [Pseudomonas sp. 250J]|uniref:hypothetical protein n=1 Tax=Pseudomonas sp. 250J TaxID=1478142 RepID=UPI0006812C00|nr:hypothetical protein [Pseudomonas sp. 250J]KNX79205.1 hypothetical protein DA83_17780 [Pseudomonas sp. 250J]